MIRCLLFTLTLIFTNQLFSQTTYYVSDATGNDTNTGTTEATPFKTIQKAIDVMNAGDEAIVKEGIYRETLTSVRNGSNGAPISIKAASGENVILTATDRVNSPWTVHSGNIYKTTLGKDVLAVFDFTTAEFDYSIIKQDHVVELMTEARHPSKPSPNHTIFETVENSNYLAFTRAKDGVEITAANFPSNIDYTGAKLYSYTKDKGFRWWSYTMEIVSSNGNVLTGSNKTGWRDSVTETQGYISGPLEFLDTEEEWASKEGVLYFNAPANADPNNLKIEAKTRHYVIDFNHDYINFEGINLYGGAVFTKGNYNNFSNIEMRHPTHSLLGRITDPATGGYTIGWSTLRKEPIALAAIKSVGNNNTFTAVDMNYVSGEGIVLRGTHNKLENSELNYTNYYGHLHHSVELIGNDCVVIGCELGDTGRSHFRTFHDNGKGIKNVKRFRVLYNDIYGNSRINHDTGSFVSWGTFAEKGEIAYNWFHDNKQKSHTALTHAVYLDNNNKEYYIHHNVFWNIRGGNIRINSPAEDVYIYNNTLGNSGENVGGKVFHNGSLKQPDGVTPVKKGYFDLYIANNYSQKPISLKGGVFKAEVLSDNVIDDTAANFLPNGFQIDAGSPATDAGVNLPFVNDNVTDGSPDVGAYEAGGVQWIPGKNRIEAGTVSILDTPVPSLADLKEDALEIFDVDQEPSEPVDTTPTTDFTQWKAKDSGVWDIVDGVATNIAQPNSLETDNERLYHFIENFTPNVQYTLNFDYTIYNVNGGTNAGFIVSIHQGELADGAYQSLLAKTEITDATTPGEPKTYELKFTPTSTEFHIVIHKLGSSGEQAYAQISNMDIIPPVSFDFSNTKWKTNSGKWNVKTNGKASNGFSSGSLGVLAYQEIIVEQGKDYEITFDYILSNSSGNTNAGIKVAVQQGDFVANDFGSLEKVEYKTAVQTPQTESGSGSITFTAEQTKVNLVVDKIGKGGKHANVTVSNVQLVDPNLSIGSFKNDKLNITVLVENNQVSVDGGSVEAIYNTLGQEVPNKNLNNGIYFVRVSNGTQSDVVKIIK